MINEILLNELKKITKEEEHILNGRQGIEKELYMSTASSYDDNNIIDAKKFLDSGKLIQVRPHTRFVHFPKHTHNYIERLETNAANSRQKLMIDVLGYIEEHYRNGGWL